MPPRPSAVVGQAKAAQRHTVGHTVAQAPSARHNWAGGTGHRAAAQARHGAAKRKRAARQLAKAHQAKASAMATWHQTGTASSARLVAGASARLGQAKRTAAQAGASAQAQAQAAQAAHVAPNAGLQAPWQASKRLYRY